VYYSLNEIESLCRKAARGAGMHWGLAEEAGKAARWLAVHGLPGPAVLADLLERHCEVAYGDLAPMALDGVWRARGENLCPLIAGATLTDRAETYRAGGVITLGPTCHPLLLAPQAGSVALGTGLAVTLEWDDVRFTVDASQGLALAGAGTALLAAMVAQVRIVVGVDVAGCRAPHARPQPVDAEVRRRLEALAHRTYAPASEASRLSGAGAKE